MKLTVETLDNYVESAVINIGKNNGYFESYIDGNDVVLFLYSKHGTIVFEKRFSLKMLKDKDASEEYSEQQKDDNVWYV